MRPSIICIAILAWVAISGCDTPLEREEADNVSAILLDVSQTPSHVNQLSWTPVEHPGFKRYWILRTRTPEVAVLDTSSLLEEDILAINQGQMETSFTDFNPVLDEGMHYQVYAEVNQRLVPSNAIPVSYTFAAFPEYSIVGNILADQDTAFMLQRHISNGTVRLVRFNLNSLTVERERNVSPNHFYQIAYGDFGTGSMELALAIWGNSVQFIDPKTFDFVDGASASWSPEAMIALPNKTLAVVMDNGARLRSYSRATNRWGITLGLEGGFSSSKSFMHLFPETNTLMIATNPDRVHQVSFDSAGNFSEDAYYKLSNNSPIAGALAIDPMMSYAMLSNSGNIFSLSDFNKVHALPVLGRENRAWGFSSTGAYIYTVGSDLPGTITAFERGSFREIYSKLLPFRDVAERIVMIGTKSYLIIQRNDLPRTSIMTMIPG